MPLDENLPGSGENSYVLPRYLRYARALALVSGAAVGVSAGVLIVSGSGFVGCCSGTPCPGQTIQPRSQDASSDVASESQSDAMTSAAPDGGDVDGGGGPRPAPLLPPAWNV